MSSYTTIAGADHPAEITGAIIVRNNMPLASLLTRELPAPLLIITTTETSGPDVAMVKDLTRRPFVLLTFDHHADREDADVEWLEAWVQALPHARPAPWLPDGGHGLPPEKVFTWGVVTAWFVAALHQYILTTRAAMNMQLATLEAKNEQHLKYLMTTAAALMTDRVALTRRPRSKPN
jgi:hypothetical protein